MNKSFKINFLRFFVLLFLAAFYLSGQSGANTGNDTAKYEGQTLCDAGDDVDMSCTTNTGKNLSVCGARKQNPYIMYMVYGSNGDINLTSPRSGKFPLRQITLPEDLPKEMGGTYYFEKDGKRYFIYSIFDYPFSEYRSSEGHGLITEDMSGNKITGYDFCKKNVEHKESDDARSRIIDYTNREEKDVSHVDDYNKLISQSVDKKMHENFYPEQ